MHHIIMHIDGDGFFASCEVSLRPALRGKPVVTGAERGIVSAMTYEAKTLGIKRGMLIGEVRKRFPQVTILSSHYALYRIFSRRMLRIVRRYVTEVEEYSIDECFADLSYCRTFAEAEAVARKIKDELYSHLGMTFSFGLAPTKVLAKIASKLQKPDGFTVIPEGSALLYLSKLPIEKVWGVGAATSAYLRKQHILSAADLALKNRVWVEEYCDRPLASIWYELNELSVLAVAATTRSENQKSISRTGTFRPASGNSEIVFSELSNNIEVACREARRVALLARSFSIFIKTKDFQYRSAHLSLGFSVSSTFYLVSSAREMFQKIFVPGEVYRSTGVTLGGLIPYDLASATLFEAESADKVAPEIFREFDRVRNKFGAASLFLASSLIAMKRHAREETRETKNHFSDFSGAGSFSPNPATGRHFPFPFLGSVE